MFLKTIDWKGIKKFCLTIICGLHFDKTSRINSEKYDEKCYNQWYVSVEEINFWTFERDAEL